MTDSVLPRSSAKHPPTRVLKTLRPVGRAVARGYWNVHVHAPSAVPQSGPVLLASNHIGFMDGPLLAAFSPRPVHALTKQEMFSGPLGALLTATGQIRLDRFHTDPAAVKTCLRVLRGGGVAAVFPEGTRGDGEFGRFHHGASYLALVTGCAVVPVSMIGTREPGESSSSVPPRGAQIDIVFGEPWRVAAVPWPRTREHVRATSVLLREHLRDELRRALALTRRSLPGPLPAGQSEDDPDTGLDETREL